MEIISLIPQFGGFIYTLVAFVVALSVIVAIHEYGHYIVGRWSGIHAEVFSLGFGPVLWARHDRFGTKWQIAALPFGGFVRFLGDADAASGKDTDAMAEISDRDDPAALRRTMHGAPLWARTATVAAGPVFNFVMSIVIFTLVFMARGAPSDPLSVGEIVALPDGFHELAAGDEIKAIEGLPTPSFSDDDAWDSFTAAIPEKPVLRFDISRDGQNMQVDGPYLFPAYVSQVAPRSAALDAGLQGGDVIIGVDGTDVFSFAQLKTKVEASDGAPLALTVWRAGETLPVTLEPRRTDEPQAEGGFATQWRIGVVGGMAFDPARSSPNPADALTGGVTQTFAIAQGSLSGLWHMVTGAISSCNISGPIGIAQASGAMASQGAASFVWFIAVLSTAVGLLNLFPIPALDGGHLVFYAYEAVTGKPPSDKALKILMTIGISMILTLMVFALSNDLFC